MEPACYLECVVDPPLETGQGTNHDDSCSQTVPEALEADVAIDFLDLGHDWGVAGLLVKDGDHGVSWVRHDGAEDTGPVT